MSKPIILWTADTPGWAYHNRVMTMSGAMADYEHRLLMGDRVAVGLWPALARQADIIVCQGIKWPERLQKAGADPKKMILRLDSMRIDIDGQYIDIFAKPPAAGPVGGG